MSSPLVVVVVAVAAAAVVALVGAEPNPLIERARARLSLAAYLLRSSDSSARLLYSGASVCTASSCAAG